jgi:glutamine amidotransferase
MGFCFGFMSNDSALLTCALEPFAEVLLVPGGAPHGWGLGYYQAGQPLLRKQPKILSEPLDFAKETAPLHSTLVIGHVREATVGGQRTENTHPFRYRNWMFCHTGTLEHFDEIREDLLRAVPEFIRRNIRGNTDSEHLFHLYLSFVNDTGRIDDQRIAPSVAAQALASTFAYADRLVSDRGGKPGDGCCLLTNGSVLVGTRRGAPLSLFRMSSYHCKDAEGKPVNVAHLKAVAVVGGRQPPTASGWETVADRGIFTIDHRLNIEHSTPT